MLTKKQQLNHNKNKDIDMLDRTITIKLPKDQVKKRVQWLLEKGPCQICEISMDLDYPHHAILGWSRKDDRTMINICVSCHRIIHTKGYDSLPKTREQVELMGWTNNEEYLHDSD